MPLPAPETPVSDVMQTSFASIGVDDPLDLADTTMQLGRIRHLPVVDGDRLVGMVSHRDLLAASLSKVLEFEDESRRTFLRSVQAGEVMTSEVFSIPAQTSIRDAARTMVKHRIGCLPVVDADGKPIGLVTETDLLEAAYGED